MPDSVNPLLERYWHHLSGSQSLEYGGSHVRRAVFAFVQRLCIKQAFGEWKASAIRKQS